METRLDGSFAEGIARIYYNGTYQQHAGLVMELLGPSLEVLFVKCHRQFTVKTITMIAIQLVSSPLATVEFMCCIHKVCYQV